MVAALLLILDVVIGLAPALVLAVGALGWFVTWWFVLPLYSRVAHRATRQPPDDDQVAHTPGAADAVR